MLNDCLGEGLNLPQGIEKTSKIHREKQGFWLEEEMGLGGRGEGREGRGSHALGQDGGEEKNRQFSRWERGRKMKGGGLGVVGFTRPL